MIRMNLVWKHLCPDPAAIVNGMVTITGNSVGDIATYTCDPGFVRIENETTTCSEVNVNNAAFSVAPSFYRREY